MHHNPCADIEDREPYWANAPAWPDYKVTRSSATPNTWIATTNAGRPGMPIFSAYLMNSELENASDEEIHAAAGRRLNQAFEQAHPNGCPGRH